MRFLIDNALSPALAIGLSEAGHDARHVRDKGMSSASDHEIFSLASKEKRILVSADTGFGALLALRKRTEPSIILFRGNLHRRADAQLGLLKAHLPSLTGDLENGCIVVFEEERIRVRRLPIEST